MIMFYLLLAAVFLTLLVLAFRRPAGAPPVSADAMTKEEARYILGVSANAAPDDIQEAYRRLMQKNHPDQGGSDYLARKINDARDTLLK